MKMREISRGIDKKLYVNNYSDASIYDATMKMAQGFYNNLTIIDPSGNEGTIAGDPPAASRYVEIRLSKYGMEFIEDIQKNAVLWKPNYDQTLFEPKFLPIKFPNLLVNGSFSIGWGFISNIPPNNFNEVCAMAIKLIKDPSIDVEDVAKAVLPDFPTGAKIINKNEVIQAYVEGQGKINVRSQIEQDEKNSQLIVKEIPFMKTTGALQEKIVELVKSGKLQDITDIIDRSKNAQVSIVISVRKGVDLSYVENQLYQLTPLEDTISVDFMCQKDNAFFRCNVKDLLTEWINFRKNTVKRIYNYDIEKLSLRKHIIEGLLIALRDIDVVIKIVKSSEDRNDIITRLMEHFGDMTKLQADNISDMKLYQLTKLNTTSLKQELSDKEDAIANLIEVLSKPERINNILIGELKDGMKKYGRDRRTELTNEKAIDKESAVVNIEYMFYITNEGLVKKIPASMDSNSSSSKYYGGKMKKNDFVSQKFSSYNLDYLLVFTNMGRVLLLRSYEVPDMSALSNIGISLNEQLKLISGERLIKVINLSKEEYENGDFYFVPITKKGLIKRTHSQHFRNINKAGLIAIKINQGDELRDVLTVKDVDNDIIIVTKKGFGIRFPMEEIPELLRTTKGVISMSLREKDEIVAVHPMHDTDMLLMSTTGICKVLSNDSLVVQRHGGKGRSVIKFENETDSVVNVLYLQKRVKVITTKSYFSQTNKYFGKAEDRSTSGDQILMLDKDDYVLTFVTE